MIILHDWFACSDDKHSTEATVNMINIFFVLWESICETIIMRENKKLLQINFAASSHSRPQPADTFEGGKIIVTWTTKYVFDNFGENFPVAPLVAGLIAFLIFVFQK